MSRTFGVDLFKEASNSALHKMSSMTTLEHLPDVVMGKIISYLHWKEKEWLLLAVPSLERLVNSPLAWENFENDRYYANDRLGMNLYFPFLLAQELDIIAKYGRFFQSCTIRIYQVQAFGDVRDNDFWLLKAVTHHCTQIKSLSIIHPADITLPKLKTYVQNYLIPMHESSLRRGTRLKLSLNRLFYSSIENMRTGITTYINYLDVNDLLNQLVCLDFSHGLAFDPHVCHIIPQLQKCTHLKILKCPVQSVNTAIITHLCKRQLKELYLVNDDHTQQMTYLEKLYLDWIRIYNDLPEKAREQFRVHYIFKNRILDNQDLIPNPFLRSLIFDNLSSNISSSLLYHIATTYGQTLRILAFCSNYWEFLMHFADLGQINETFKFLGQKCIQLKSFLSCLSLPSSALVSLAKNSPQISTIRVYKENVRLATADKPEFVFLQKMAQAIETCHWDMIKKKDNIFILPNADCSLLFTNCFSEL